MSQLAQLQTDFQAYLFDENKGIAFKSKIIDDTKVGARKRLGIYYDAYRFRIIQALAIAYPKLHLLLGDNLFDSTARAYIDQYPSTYYNMRWVGADMQTHLRWSLPQHPVAAEMAAFEWALSLAFDAEDVPSLTLQDLAAIPPEDWADLKFAFHPSLHLLQLQWNVLPIWAALNSEETPPKTAKKNVTCLIWRMNLNSHYRSLDVAEHVALKSAIAGESFGALCEQLQENASEEEATLQAAQYLSGWLNDSLIAKAV